MDDSTICYSCLIISEFTLIIKKNKSINRYKIGFYKQQTLNDPLLKREAIQGLIFNV